MQKVHIPDRIINKIICFTAETKVFTKDGYKNIQYIGVGDEVYSQDPETGEKGIKKVKNVYINETDTLIHVFAGKEEIRTTTEHPFWAIDKGWVAASKLEVGDKLLMSSGKIVKVSAIKQESLTKPVKVYNFEVEDWHTYFVSNSGILVHNTCGGKNGVFENAPYHGKTSNSVKSKAPIDGQGALDNSVSIGPNTTRRVGISQGEFVVLDETGNGIFHGHVREWGDLTQEMQAALRKSGLVNKKGKIIE
jgi:hypothetical protein